MSQSRVKTQGIRIKTYSKIDINIKYICIILLVRHFGVHYVKFIFKELTILVSLLDIKLRNLVSNASMGATIHGAIKSIKLLKKFQIAKKTQFIKPRTWLTSTSITILSVVTRSPVLARVVSAVVDVLLAEVTAVTRTTLAVEISDCVPTFAPVLTWVLL